MVPAPAFRLLPAVATLVPGVVWAQAAVPHQDLGGSVVQMLLGLGLVIALMIAGLWLLKRLSLPRGEAAGLMRVVAGTAVGPRERVVVVEVGETWLVLGVAPGRVNALAEVPRGSSPQPTPQSSPDFAGWLRRTLDRSRAR
ncbi:MAG TPA: flagellar biosynthetic protein FliO [Rhodocyclaceae bacterium]|nr:flagellar biosynthetic protein FliO [Rhodocyclaceae bacterium]